MGILMVYDVTDEASFNNIRNWMKNIEQHASDNVVKARRGGKGGAGRGAGGSQGFQPTGGPGQARTGRGGAGRGRPGLGRGDRGRPGLGRAGQGRREEERWPWEEKRPRFSSGWSAL